MTANPIHYACPTCEAPPGYQCLGKRKVRRSCHRDRWQLAYGAPVRGPGIREPIGRALAKAVFERDAYRCVVCRDHIDLTCDHIIPVSRGGETCLANLQTMCRRCNSRKGNRQ